VVKKGGALTKLNSYTRRTVLAAGTAGVAAAVVGARIAGLGPFASSGACFLCIDSTANLDASYYGYIDGPSGLVSKLGRNYAGIRKNYRPDDTPTISPEITYAVLHRRPWIYQNGKPNPIPPDTLTSGTYWRSIATGNYDTIFNHFFATVRGDTRWSAANPFHYSWHHEQTTLADPPSGKLAGSAADYIAAHRHVYALLVSSGAHISVGGNMKLCLVPNIIQVMRDPVYGTGLPSSAVAPYVISKIDPGPAYYDHAGADVYLKEGGSETPADQYAPLHTWAKAAGKSWLTGEMGVASTKDPPTYLAELDALLKGWGAGTGPGQVYALCATSRIALGGDYRWDASPTILAAWKKLALDPFYGATVG
jgi:hypothetical protein